ncbi:MAG: hypothetical protein NWE84_06430 [Candidatus Bathyarchaeota archaeon]|nr:hypothetical protein [Candidatus Bathyarchaeota archaeon]
MQENNRNRLDELFSKDAKTTRRTTIILEKEERDFVDQMIKEGKEPGIKPLISKMLNIYRSMMIYDWRFPGEYYCGISRIAFVNVELLNILIQHIPKEKWGGIGKEMGAALKVSMETILGLQATQFENWESIFKRLRVQGFGDFYLKDKYLLLKTPFIGYPELWEGILEGLFDVELDIKTMVPPLVFEVKTQKTPSE